MYTCVGVEKVIDRDCLLHILVPAVTSHHHRHHYMCDLNFLGTHIEASVLFLEPGYDNSGDYQVPLPNLG
jgi:hypothetical protein